MEEDEEQVVRGRVIKCSPSIHSTLKLTMAGQTSPCSTVPMKEQTWPDISQAVGLDKYTQFSRASKHVHPIIEFLVSPRDETKMKPLQSDLVYNAEGAMSYDNVAPLEVVRSNIDLVSLERTTSPCNDLDLLPPDFEPGITDVICQRGNT